MSVVLIYILSCQVYTTSYECQEVEGLCYCSGQIKMICDIICKIIYNTINMLYYAETRNFK